MELHIRCVHLQKKLQNSRVLQPFFCLFQNMELIIWKVPSADFLIYILESMRMLTAAVPSRNLTRLSLSFSVRHRPKSTEVLLSLFINTRTGIHFPGNTYQFCYLFCSIWYSFDLQSSLLRPPDLPEFPEPSIDYIREIPTFQ